MAKMIPPLFDPNSTSRGEVEVFTRLRDDPHSANWVVLHSFDISTHCSRVAGEVDFLVIIPGKGVLAVEVKGARRIRRENGLWYYGNTPEPDPRGPFKQASQGMHSIRKRLLMKRPDLSGVLFWSAVVFPFVDFTIDSDEWHRWQAIDSRDMRSDSLAARLEGVLDDAKRFLLEPSRRAKVSWYFPDSGQPYIQQVEAIAAELRTDFQVLEPTGWLARRSASDTETFTREQFLALDAMQANPRVIFSGPAGTGKTTLAIEALKRSHQEGRRALLLCYNNNLAAHLRFIASTVAPGAVCSTLHSLMLEVAGCEADYASAHFWNENLPSLAIDRLLDGFCDMSFDEVIVDEAQDILRRNFLDFIDCILLGGLSAGRWRLFADFERQAIYAQSNLSLDEFVALTRNNAPLYSLRVNYRNTPRVAALIRLIGGLDPDYSGIRRFDDGVEPQLLFYGSQEEQRKQLAKVLGGLEQEGFQSEDILVLSPLSSGCCASSNPNLVSYSSDLPGKVRYASIHAYKGLEAPAIVITDVDFGQTPVMKDLLYIALSRSLCKLVLLVSEATKHLLFSSL